MITEEQEAKLLAWWKSKGVKHDCPSCGGVSWDTGADVFASPLYAGGGQLTGGKLFPMMPVLCTNCGYVRLYSAVMIGLTR